MDCFDREHESERMWRHFDGGRDVLLLAPRRVGKTVLLQHLKEQAGEKGRRAILIDVEGHREEKAFFRQLCAAIQEEISTGQAIMTALKDRLRRLIPGGDGAGDWRSILMTADWQDFADHLLATLESAQDGGGWLILVDEVPLFTKELIDTHGVERAREFLYSLRNLRQKHRTIRWLFTGSIGLDAIARRHGLEGALVDMEAESLEPFDRETALRYLAHLAGKQEVAFEPGAMDRILDRLGWLAPYYIEKIADQAFDMADRGKLVSVDAAERSADAMLDLGRRVYWATWREHLDKNFDDPERTRLFTILAGAARTAEGVTVDTLLVTFSKEGTLDPGVLGEHLDTLEADGYLSTDRNRTRYRFRMNLLREWWLRYVAPARAEEATHG
ncbi:MAG: ATP-binding protein [Deltaproteobacteria bacterium]|nr:ATP-binding protein [Deltaproteobacteria bacterium]